MLSRNGNLLWPCLAGLLLLLAFRDPAEAEEIYRYKRVWPMLQQRYHFREPSGVAVSPAGFVYVVDKANYRIQKYTLDGQFLAKWGSKGEGDGQFGKPHAIAVGPDGSVYILDPYRGDVQKFTADGQFITRWPNSQYLTSASGIAVDSLGDAYVLFGRSVRKFSTNGQLIKKWQTKGKDSEPSCIAADPSGHVYIADYWTGTISKYTADGDLLKAKRTPASFTGIAADAKGNLYAADEQHYRIKKFSSDLKLINGWGGEGAKDGKFLSPQGVAVDATGIVHVTDSAANQVQQFSADGEFLTKWASYGSGKGQFWAPSAVAIDAERNMYVADKKNHRIQKFAADGQFLIEWGREGAGNGEFRSPAFIVADTKSNIYVADPDACRIQKFTSSGEFLCEWGKEGDCDGCFWNINGMAIDGNDRVYVTEEDAERVQQFDAEGRFLLKWGAPESVGNWWPSGIAVDADGKVHVADTRSVCVWTFTADGKSLGHWGARGDGKGQFDWFFGVALAADALGNVYVADPDAHRVQKFTSSGRFISVIGKYGTEPGQLSGPCGVAVDANGTVYVAEAHNNRVTAFEPVSQEPGTKAIVLAGGGPYEGNTLWSATQMVSNLAFRALRYQGFAKAQIRYLTSNTKQDLDDNGKFDDLGSATKSNLRTAITEWPGNAEKLLIYLNDHGREGKFQINATDGEDSNLTAKELALWLEELPATQVVVIIDACYAGSFLETIKGGNRVVITSTAAAEKAQFGLGGSLSFSNYFWAQVFNGANLQQAFTTASQAVSAFGSKIIYPQTPQVDADGDGDANENEEEALLADLKLLNQTQSYNQAPVVEVCSATPNPIPDGNNTAILRAEGVTDADGIQRVWAVIWSPNFSATGTNPITELPYVNLQPVDGKKNTYEAPYRGFTASGTHYVLCYAMDRQDNVSTPRQVEVIATTPRTHKAILVAGGTGTDPWFEAVAYNTGLAYRALRAQSYVQEDIRVLSTGTIDETIPVHGTANGEMVREAIQNWAGSGTQDLVVYLVGTGESGAFQLGQNEKLDAYELAAWLASIEGQLPGNITVVYDGCHSGSFLRELKGRKRIIMASTRADQSACLANGGISSFSQFFWLGVLDGVNLHSAFLKAQKVMAQIARNQAAQLDDDGDGNTTVADGQLAKLYRIGPGFSLGSDPPIIKTACRDLTVKTGNTATIWVEGVTTTGILERVWAVVVPPDYQPETSTTPGGEDFRIVELDGPASGRYQAAPNVFTTSGQYLVTVFAADTEGNVSQPKVIEVTRK